MEWNETPGRALVADAPSCRSSGVAVVGAARGESVVIVCEVDADPPAAVFKWKFNNSGETLDVAADRYTSNGSASSLKCGLIFITICIIITSL